MSRPHGECCKARAWNLRWSQKQKHEERQQYSKAKNGNQLCQDRGESVNPVKYPVRMNKAMPGEEVAELLAGLCSKSAEPGPGGAHSWA
jgi:hypothetical protein